MIAAVLPLILGLLLGLTLHWVGFSRPKGLRNVLALHRRNILRSALYVLGVPMALTALLCWLAVIDVDGIVVLPLTPALLAGAAIYGVAVGLAGCTPLTAFALLGGSHWAEALCTLAGCAVAGWLLPMLSASLTALREALILSDATLFRMTLDEPFLLGGGFAGQAWAGLLLMTIAICVLPRRAVPSPAVAEDPAAPAADTPESDPLPDDAPVPPPADETTVSPDADDEMEAPSDEAVVPDETPTDETDASEFLLLPASVPDDAFVALLPGEEPLVVDMVENDDLTENADVKPGDARKPEQPEA